MLGYTYFMSIVLLCILVFLVWWWLTSLRAREAALNACRRACSRERVQLLDETVMVRRLGFARDREGRIRIRRTYSFEFSNNGHDRRQGEAICLGRSPEVVRADWPLSSDPSVSEAKNTPQTVIPLRGSDGTRRH
ncbi:DUF3301 domain-containing protein [Acidihalobacter prosperus]